MTTVFVLTGITNACDGCDRDVLGVYAHEADARAAWAIVADDFDDFEVCAFDVGARPLPLSDL